MKKETAHHLAFSFRSLNLKHALNMPRTFVRKLFKTLFPTLSFLPAESDLKEETCLSSSQEERAHTI